jgi:hypothetical protein
MGGTSRAGNERLRVLLVIGATSVIKAAVRPGSKHDGLVCGLCCNASRARSPPWRSPTRWLAWLGR